jgi:hypothetical protein
MRYGIIALVVMGLGITAMAPVASAEWVNNYGNQVMPLQPGSATGGCYMDGAIHSCTQPAPLTLPSLSGSGGSLAGGSEVCPMFGSCYHPPFWGGDKN